jgi:hypothetical protein
MRGASIAALLSLAFLSGCATQPRLGDSVDVPVPTTIEAVRADPAQYHHKFIQLRGLIDACTPWGCDLLAVRPSAIPAKADFRASILASVPFDFVPAPGSSAEDGAIDRSADLMQELYRFSEVTLVGQYNASCALGHDPDDVPQNGKPQNQVICLDHTGDLQVYRVLTVHKRWPSSAGALWGYKPTPLSLLPPEPAQSLFESFKAAALIPKTDQDALDGEHRAFVDPRRPDKGVLCICRAKTCEGKWPSGADDLVPAPANPYQCTIGIRTETGWRFPAEWFK